MSPADARRSRSPPPSGCPDEPPTSLTTNLDRFGGSIKMFSAFMAVLMLRDLGLSTRDYGLSLGLPYLGRVAGSRLALYLTRWFGRRRVLLASRIVRAPWMLLYLLSSHGIGGLVLIVLAGTACCSLRALFNPTFSTYRMEAAKDGFVARVTSSWSISSKLVQPESLRAAP
jgi:MFS family permease